MKPIRTWAPDCRQGDGFSSEIETNERANPLDCALCRQGDGFSSEIETYMNKELEAIARGRQGDGFSSEIETTTLPPCRRWEHLSPGGWLLV